MLANLGRSLTVLGCFGLFVSVANATSLNVTVHSGGSSAIQVAPGATVNYEVTGVLSDESNEGLALVLFDLSFDGGALNQAVTPTTSPMNNFARPLGATNPAGYGGTLVGGNLVQVCGSQNTIKNTKANAPFPIGSVITGVAWPSNPNAQVLVTGSLTAPMTAGAYTLSISNVAASVIREDEDGSGAFWAVDLATPGTVQHLSITVNAVPVDPTVAAVGPRYLGISLGNRTNPFALLVKAPCNGKFAKYVGTPSGLNSVARLVDDPMDAAFLTPAQWSAAGTTIYVTGIDVVPDELYELQTDIGTPGNPNLLATVSTTTWGWGDLDDNNILDVDDISCALEAFIGNYVQCSLYASDIMSFNPNEINDVDDIVGALDAFQGLPYQGPSPCPK